MTTFGNTVALSESEKTKFITKTYGWMAFALLISAVVAFITANSIFDSNGITSFGKFLFAGSRIGFWIFAIAEIVLVWWLSSAIKKISVATATIGFLVYAVLNGLTLSSILFVYTLSSIGGVFLGCSAMFAIMSFYGAKTQKNLSTFGKYLMMGLFGVIIANLIQFVISMITGNPLTIFDFLISIACVAIFTGLTAYDTQKLVAIAENANGSDDYKKVSIIAALELYLDFINLFLALLRLFGKRR